MPSTHTVVIGAGQAGLSLSRRLARAGHPHVVLERGRIAERWQSERWDSLSLLSPNWLNRLDGSPAHDDPNGFLGRAEFVDYLRRYAAATGPHVREHVTVTSVEQGARGYHVETDAGPWRAQNVVVATGDLGRPMLPAAASAVPPGVLQLHASRYRRPSALPPGGVVVVGAGPSGQQIAAELRRAGRRVVLAVGGHARAPRRYRGRDVFEWMQAIGDLDVTIDEVPDPLAAKRTPSFTLTGANGGEQLDLAVLHALGVEITGRLERFSGAVAHFAGDLEANVGAAEERMRRLLGRIDDHIAALALHDAPDDLDPLAAVRLPVPRGAVDLAAEGISTVVWATGYRRAYPWLHVPVLDDNGQFVQRRGVTASPGLYVLGLRFQHRRSSHFIGGVGADAAYLAELLGGSRQAQPGARLTAAHAARRRHPALVRPRGRARAVGADR
jgi:putative flavoprotein involved in K+ transport